MTLGELADRYCLELQDETIGVRKSWEEMFRYTFRHCSEETDMSAFEVNSLSDRLLASGMKSQIVDGYVKRWAALLSWPKGYLANGVWTDNRGRGQASTQISHLLVI